jgi:prepilin peptidase CpaA
MLSFTWVIFVVLVFAAAARDLVSYRIPNVIVMAVIGLFGILSVLHFSDVEWLSHLGAFAAVFGAGVLLYALGQMGAGDVKLLGAVALWSGAWALIPLLFWVSLCGLVAMFAILIARAFVPRLESMGFEAYGLPRVLVKGEGIPYGIGIGPGAIIASFTFPAWLWHL